MHLINAKLAGQDVPTVLPNSLIPPNLRGSQTADRPEVTPPSSASKDLFDLFNDSEVTPSVPAGGVPATTAFLPQPPSRRGAGATATSRQLPVTRAAQSPEPFSTTFGMDSNCPTPLTFAASASQPAGDLLGDDSAANVPEKSADIGNKKLQLENTNKGLSQLEKSKSELEEQDSTNVADLQTLERELASARSKHEAETKAVSDLRVRVGEQTAKLKQLRADVISAESDLNAMRMEKDELGQSFLRDKEEVRGLHKQIKELEDEKTGLKLLLDKVRKEARQQKGLVSIAKKQVSSAEAGRDAAQTEVRDAERANKDHESSQTAAISASPLHTPRALSPNATGASQRSTNPFERFRTPSAEPSPVITAAAASGAVTGAALGGVAMAGGASVDFDESADQSPPDGPRSVQPQPQEQDPFGMPVMGSAIPSATGFDDSFGQQAITTGQGPTDFDSAFADFDTEAAHAAPPAEDDTATAANQLAPLEAAVAATPLERLEGDRSLPSLAIPPSSHHGMSLPTEEQQSGEQPSPVVQDEDSVADKTESTTAAVPGDPESSDDEDGPEDVEGPRRSYGIEHRSPSPDAASHPPPANADADHSAARVRRHAPPPPTGRQSSRSESVASPSTDERNVGTSGLPAASSPIDPFGVPVATPPTSADYQPQGDAGKVDFEGTFDPLSTSAGTSAIQTVDTPDLPGAFPEPVGDSHAAPKASEFDDEDDFDFSDMPPTAGQPPPTSTMGGPEPQDQFATPFGKPPSSQQQPTEQHHRSQDFSELQPGAQQQPQPVGNAFDDEFANFDEDFGEFPSQPNSGSDNNSSMLRSYEVVGPDHVKQPGDGGMDAWGVSNNSLATATQPTALSFDDAFGGDFSPAP